MAVKAIGAFLVLGACMFAPVAHAQLTLFFTRELALTISPQYPNPGDTVRLSITSYALDLDRSFITWEANGEVISSGSGVKEVVVTAGEMGSTLAIEVRAEDDAGNAGRATATIRPAQIDLLWSTNSYTPPFYKGRKHAGTSPKIDAYALVRFMEKGALVKESDIIYTWTRNGAVIEEISGRGKSQATLSGPARGTESIGVIAETADQTQRIEASVPVRARDAQLLLFEEHPLYGTLFHRAIVGEVNTTEDELHVTAVPYFARISDPRLLEYEWRLNDTPIPTDTDTPQTLVVTAKGYSGPAVITLAAMNPDDILMRSSGTWRILFGESGGLFSRAPFFGE